MKNLRIFVYVLLSSGLSISARADEQIDLGYEGVYDVVSDYHTKTSSNSYMYLNRIAILKVATLPPGMTLPPPGMPGLNPPFLPGHPPSQGATTPANSLPGTDIYHVHMLDQSMNLDVFAFHRATLNNQTNTMTSAEPNRSGVLVDFQLSVDSKTGEIKGQVWDTKCKGWKSFSGKINIPKLDDIGRDLSEFFPGEKFDKDSFIPLPQTDRESRLVEGVYRGKMVGYTGSVFVKRSDDGQLGASFQSDEQDLVNLNFSGAAISDSASKMGVFELINTEAGPDRMSKVIVFNFQLKGHEDTILWIGVGFTATGQYYSVFFHRVGDVDYPPPFVPFPVQLVPPVGPSPSDTLSN